MRKSTIALLATDTGDRSLLASVPTCAIRSAQQALAEESGQDSIAEGTLLDLRGRAQRAAIAGAPSRLERAQEAEDAYDRLPEVASCKGAPRSYCPVFDVSDMPTVRGMYGQRRISNDKWSAYIAAEQGHEGVVVSIGDTLYLAVAKYRCTGHGIVQLIRLSHKRTRRGGKRH